MMTYRNSHLTKNGVHIQFDVPVTADNFKDACQYAIDLSKVKCSVQNAVGINFEAHGIPVQVVECDSAEIQFSLWMRKLNERTAAMKPIKTERVFADAGGMLSVLWGKLCAVENELAEKLQHHPLGTAVILDGDAWLLADEVDCLVLCHANYIDNEASDSSSRFDFGLEWVDLEEDVLSDYIDRVQRALSEFSTVKLLDTI